MLWLDSTMLLLIPAILFSLYAQWKVSSTFKKYSRVPSKHRQTGAEVATAILRGQGTEAGVDKHVSGTLRTALAGVQVAGVGGNLTDHYDPSSHTLRLSEPVYGSSSIAAISVAAHETGHALQHAVSYPYLALRSMAVPIANYGSMLTFPIIIGGMLLGALAWALNIAIILYLGVVIFTIITLPVEFNASRRALAVLEKGGYLEADEMPGARAVLQAAALTYVAATFSAVMTLLRLILLRNMQND